MKANGLKIEDSDSEEEDPVRRVSSDMEDSDEEEEGTGVMTSQLRHFVIQEYVPRPLLFDIGQTPHDPDSALSGYKVSSYQSYRLRSDVLTCSSIYVPMCF